MANVPKAARRRGARVVQLAALGVELALAVTTVAASVAIAGAVRAALDVGQLAVTSAPPLWATVGP